MTREELMPQSRGIDDKNILDIIYRLAYGLSSYLDRLIIIDAVQEIRDRWLSWGTESYNDKHTKRRFT